MDKERKKELKEQAKKEKTYMGAYTITNLQSGKVFLATSRNLKNQWMRLLMELKVGRHPNRELQEDFTRLGEDSFAFAILEEEDKDEEADVSLALYGMQRDWAAKLDVYSEKGYNKRKPYE